MTITFNAKSGKQLWSSFVDTAAPIPRVGEVVRHDGRSEVWEVTDVEHIWWPDGRVPGHSTALAVVVHVKPCTRVLGKAAK